MWKEWKELAQSLLLGLLLSFLVARLISMALSFREAGDGDGDAGGAAGGAAAAAAVVEETREEKKEEVEGEGEGDEDEDDWEDVESTELDEAFSAATAFVAAAAADRRAGKVSSEVQLRLYGLYKIATEGPCSTPQPSAIKMSARAKWNAWQKLGAMPPEEAMQKYIAIVTDIYPTWLSVSISKGKTRETDTSNTSKRTMGPVFSSFVHEEESEKDLKMDEIHALARDGEINKIIKCIQDGISVNSKDSEGRTPLHWAVDRGHSDIIELLIRRNTDVNAQDNDGQTPLHYAVLCDRKAIIELLLKHNADNDIKDSDGCSSKDLFLGNTDIKDNVASSFI